MNVKDINKIRFNLLSYIKCVLYTDIYTEFKWVKYASCKQYVLYD